MLLRGVRVRLGGLIAAEREVVAPGLGLEVALVLLVVDVRAQKVVVAAAVALPLELFVAEVYKDARRRAGLPW